MLQLAAHACCCGVSVAWQPVMLKHVPVYHIQAHSCFCTAIQNCRQNACAFAPLQSHKDLCDGIVALAKEVQGDQLLTNLIRRKFAIKCTT